MLFIKAPLSIGYMIVRAAEFHLQEMYILIKFTGMIRKDLKLEDFADDVWLQEEDELFAGSHRYLGC